MFVAVVVCQQPTALNLNVVAEGVENGGTLDILHELGCDTAQGYYIARPLGPDQLTAFLTASQTTDIASDTTTEWRSTALEPLATELSAAGTAAASPVASGQRSAVRLQQRARRPSMKPREFAATVVPGGSRISPLREGHEPDADVARRCIMLAANLVEQLSCSVRLAPTTQRVAE